MNDKAINSVQNYKYWVGKWLETQGAKLDWAMSEVDDQPDHMRIPQATPLSNRVSGLVGSQIFELIFS